MAGLPRFRIDVFITNKPAIRDPEGESILKDLAILNGFDAVKSIRTGKVLALEVEAENIETAKTKVIEMCDSLRLYNPLVSSCSVRVGGG